MAHDQIDFPQGKKCLSSFSMRIRREGSLFPLFSYDDMNDKERVLIFAPKKNFSRQHKNPFKSPLQAPPLKRKKKLTGKND